jgi:translation elongation factor EF-G
MVSAETILRHALQEGIKITLVVNKIDRLILELRIKPADAFYKIKHTIEEINTFIRFASLCCAKFSFYRLTSIAKCSRSGPRAET